MAGIDAEPALARIEERLAETVDRMKTSADPIPVVVVGGGSILLRETLPGASELVKPDHFAVANAIGAAIAQVGGEVDKVVALEGTTRAAALDEAKAEAIEKAVAAGADRDGVRVVDVEDVPIAYLAGRRDADSREGHRRPRPRGGWALRLVGEAELEDIAVGAAILGTGGGGDPYIGKLLAQEAVRRYGPVADGLRRRGRRTTRSSSPRR